MDDFNGDFKTVIKDIFSIREANVFSVIFVAVVFLSSTISLVDWVGTGYDQAVNAKIDKTWTIQFNVSTDIAEHQEVWQDEETKIIDFPMDSFSFPENFLVGNINVTVQPDIGNLIEDPAAQCDAISVTIIRDEESLSAQWEDSDNILAGQDSSCEEINLNLRTYPYYTGQDIESEAVNEYQALMPWTETDWGKGVLEVEIGLDVNSVEQLQDWVQNDDDEEITIIVEIQGFIASAALN